MLLITIEQERLCTTHIFHIFANLTTYNLNVKSIKLCSKTIVNYYTNKLNQSIILDEKNYDFSIIGSWITNNGTEHK